MDPDVADVLLAAHSGLRWLLLALMLGALLVTVRSLRSGGFGMPNRVAMLLFRILITLQWLVGLLVLVTREPFELDERRIEHALTMTLAMGLTHVFGGRRFKRPVAQLLLLVVVLALVLFTMLRPPLPQDVLPGPGV